MSSMGLCNFFSLKCCQQLFFYLVCFASIALLYKNTPSFFYEVLKEDVKNNGAVGNPTFFNGLGWSARMYGRDNARNIFVFQYTDFYLRNIYDFPCCSVCQKDFLFFFSKEMVLAISSLSRGSLSEKLRWYLYRREREGHNSMLYILVFHERVFTMYDSDGDGVIHKSEIRDVIVAAFRLGGHHLGK